MDKLKTKEEVVGIVCEMVHKEEASFAEHMKNNPGDMQRHHDHDLTMSILTEVLYGIDNLYK